MTRCQRKRIPVGLVYAEGLNGADRRREALAIIESSPANGILPVQVLGEIFAVLVRKAGRTPAKARLAILDWRDAFPLVETTPDVLLGAAELAASHGLAVWDAVSLSAAAEADCRYLLSEEMHDGFTWRGTSVLNPFRVANRTLIELR